MTMQSQKIIIANWKMNCLAADVNHYLDVFIGKLSASQSRNEVVICPAHTHLSVVSERARSSKLFKAGAQDCATAEKGAFTGDVSAVMIEDAGADYVLIGHSERRQHHHEDNTILRKKLEQALKNNLCPVLCVGETLLDREEEHTLTVIESQLAVLHGLDHRQLVVAYEPVWAIGTGRVPSVADVDEVHRSIIGMLSDRGLTPAAILYGGSVTPDNSSTLLQSPLIGGLLVGGASLDPLSFYRIASA